MRLVDVDVDAWHGQQQDADSERAAAAWRMELWDDDDAATDMVDVIRE